MAAEVEPARIIASERFCFRLSPAELRQLRAYAAAEGMTPSEAIREARYQHGVLELTEEAGRTRPGPIQQTSRRAADVLARGLVRRYLKGRGYWVLTVGRSLPGLSLLAIDAHQVRAIHVADAAADDARCGRSPGRHRAPRRAADGAAGCREGAEDGWEAQVPVLAGLASASVQATRGSGQRWADQAVSSTARTWPRAAAWRGRTASVCMPAWSCRPASGCAWSRCVGMCCAPQWPPIGWGWRLMAGVLVTLRHGWADGTVVVGARSDDVWAGSPGCSGRASICCCIRACSGRGSAWRAEVVRLAGRQRPPKSNRRPPTRRRRARSASVVCAGPN